MNRIAIIVQRCHENAVGGAESLAWQYATLLKENYEVEILTTTATDAGYWANVLPEGKESRDGITIRRFHVDIGYSPYRSSLFSCLLRDFEKYRPTRNGKAGPSIHLPWSIALQEELIRNIGPYSEQLLKFIREKWADYRTMIFVTYLYPTAYFGLSQVPQGYGLFAPTLHDEAPAYLSAYKHAARRAGTLLWLSEGERRLGKDLWGELPGRVIGTYIEAERVPGPKIQDRPYLLYCGRIDPHKGCTELFEYFQRFKQANPSPLRLVLTGKDDVEVPADPDIEFLGFVSDEEKFRLMSGATVYMMPSGKESFSIVTLEALAQETPVLASGVCEVIVDHITHSGGGKLYRDYDTFSARLSEMLTDAPSRLRMGVAGRKYVVSNFNPARIQAALIDAIESRARAFAGNGEGRLSAVETQPNKDEKPRVFVEPTAIDISYSPAMPLPAGWSEADLRSLVTSIYVEDGPVEELRNYATTDFKRFVYTLGFSGTKPRVYTKRLKSVVA